MMAQKSRKLEEYLSLRVEAQRTASYADYFAQRSLFTALKIKNDGAQDENGLKISIHNENGLLLPFEKAVDLPFEKHPKKKPKRQVLFRSPKEPTLLFLPKSI